MKILIATTRFPRKLGKPDSFTVFKLIEFLSPRHEIALITFYETKRELEDLASLKKICSEVHLIKRNKLKSLLSLFFNILNIKPFQVNYFKSNKFKKIAQHVYSDFKPDIGYAHLIRASEFIKELKLKKIIAYQISHILNYERLVKNKKFGLKKIFYSIELFLVKKYERSIVHYFSKMLFIGQVDYSTTFPQMQFLDKLFISPHGVDLEYFSRKRPIPRNKTIIFPASFSAETNREACEWFCLEIYPFLIKEVQDVKVIFAGRNPSNFLKNFAKQNQNILVTGYVKDIRIFYEEAAILFNPVRSCAGQQNKILTGMAMQIPVVSTFEANEAINAEHEKHILLSESNAPEKFAQNIIKLLNNDKLREEIGLKGYKFVKEKWSWEKHFKDLEENLLNKIF